MKMGPEGLGCIIERLADRLGISPLAISGQVNQERRLASYLTHKQRYYLILKISHRYSSLADVVRNVGDSR